MSDFNGRAAFGLLAFTAALCVPVLAVADDAVVVFRSGSEGYHTYRIPAIVVTKKGTLLAFCEGRKSGRSDSGNIDLVLKRSTDGGKTWGSLQVVWDDQDHTCGNPCPVVDQNTGTIWLPLTWNRGEDTEAKIKAGTAKDSRRVFLSHSRDDGLHWAAPAEITSTTKAESWRWYATGPGVGIQITEGPRKGRLVIPCDHSTAAGEFRSHSIHSDDGGKTWNRGGTIQPDVNECQVAELSGGKLLMNLRNYSKSEAKCRAVSTSEDGGDTWSPMGFDRALIEPICQASLLRLWHATNSSKAPTLLFSNPASEKSRDHMTVRFSRDGGKTWPTSKLLYPGPAAYSNLVELADGSLACFYERGEKHAYETIVFHPLEKE